jgi:hypothetical protein
MTNKVRVREREREKERSGSIRTVHKSIHENKDSNEQKSKIIDRFQARVLSISPCFDFRKICMSDFRSH